MKKPMLVIFFVLILFVVVGLPVLAAEPTSKTTDPTDFANSIWTAIKGLAIRVTTLEQRIVELTQKIENISLIPGPQGPQGPVGQSGTSLHLIDGNGQDLGLLLNADGGNGVNGIFSVFRPDKDIFFRLSTQYHRGEPTDVNWSNGNHIVFFTDNNCTGTPMSNVGFLDPQLLVRVGNLNNGGTRYFKSVNQQSQTIQFQSRMAPESSCVNDNDQSQSMYVLEEISMPFQEPLAFPLIIKMQ